MQVAVETTEGLERLMTVTFPVTDMNKDIQSRLRQLSKTTKINGFRPGKIPPHVIEQRFGQQVNAEAVNEQIQKTFYQAVADEKLRPAGGPEIQEVNDKEKDVLTYKAKFEVYPDFEIATMDGSEFEKPKVSIKAADIKKTIDNIQKQHQHFHEVERNVKDNDKLTVNFTGTIEGEGFEGNEGKDVSILLGSKQMIEGFESGLVGSKLGEEKILELNFPEDYHFEAVAGKPVVFKVEILKIEEPHLPELDDEFFKKFGVTDGGLDAFKAEVKQNMKIELDKAITSAKKNSVMDKVLELNPIDVPKALVMGEAKAMAEKMKQQYQVQGDNLEQDLSLFEEEAKKRVSLGLVLSEIVKINKIKVTDKELEKKITSLSQSYENPQEVINYYLNDKDRRFEMESIVLEEKVVDWAFKQANVTDKSLSFTEFMTPDEAK